MSCPDFWHPVTVRRLTLEFELWWRSAMEQAHSSLTVPLMHDLCMHQRHSRMSSLHGIFAIGTWHMMYGGSMTYIHHRGSSFCCALDTCVNHASKAQLGGMSLLHGICAICHVPLAHTPQRELAFDACMPITIDFNSLEYWIGCSVQLKAFKQGDYCVDKRLNQIQTLCPGSAWHFGKTKI